MKKKVLVQYYYQPKNVLRGVVVAVDREAVGWSLCHDNDEFSKKKGINMAIGRARRSQTLEKPEKIEAFYNSIPQSLTELYNKMTERSIRYFKQ